MNQNHLKMQNRAAGWLILFTAIFYLCTSFLPLASLWASLCAWLAVVMSWPALSRSSKQQSSILFGIGGLLLIWAGFVGGPVLLKEAATRNLPLLTMFVAVSFLSLTNPSEEDQSQPTGRKGFWSTLGACHLLGSVINLSIVFVVGDRLARGGKLSQRQTQVIMRGFCSGAYWSPFFVASGVAMTYSPGAQWQHTMVPGILMAVAMAIITFWEVKLGNIEAFKGYPLKVDSLIMPIVLATIVLVCHHLFTSIPILTLISIVAPVGAVFFMRVRPRVQALSYYINGRLSNVASQFALFLAAGVFSTGIGSLLQVYPNIVVFHASELTPLVFLVVSGGMILVSLIGVHPVVSISLMAPLLAPLGASANQLAFLFLSVWGTGTASSPLSGVGLAMISRYQATSRNVLKLNFRYMILLWLIATGIDWILF